MRRQDKYPDTNVFHFYNANPKNRYTDDCVIRAITNALDQTYEETYKEMFELSLSNYYSIYSQENIDRYLESKGWIKHKQLRKSDNTKYTGKEFCKYFQDHIAYLGQSIIANIGGQHMVCIKEVYSAPTRDVKIHDIWDCSDCCVGNYWTKYC